jgi:hypothetical protein
MSVKLFSSTIALALALGLSYPTYAKKGGEKADAAGDVAGDKGDVAGKAGDATVNQGRQNQNVGRNQETGPQQGRQEARQANFGNVISALNNVSAQVENVNALNNVNVVDAVDVNNVLSGNNVQALNNALNRNDVDINVLRDAINNNDVHRSAPVPKPPQDRIRVPKTRAISAQHSLAITGKLMWVEERATTGGALA